LAGVLRLARLALLAMIGSVSEPVRSKERETLLCKKGPGGPELEQESDRERGPEDRSGLELKGAQTGLSVAQ